VVRVVARAQIVQALVVAVALFQADLPVGALARHGAWPWAVVTMGLMVWPVVLVVAYRSPVLWTAAVGAWALTTFGVVARLHTWMTVELWVLAAASLLLSATAAGTAWGTAGERRPVSRRGGRWAR
jgi:hypothetical protein